MDLYFETPLALLQARHRDFNYEISLFLATILSRCKLIIGYLAIELGDVTKIPYQGFFFKIIPVSQFFTVFLLPGVKDTDFN